MGKTDSEAEEDTQGLNLSVAAQYYIGLWDPTEKWYDVAIWSAWWQQ